MIKPAVILQLEMIPEDVKLDLSLKRPASAMFDNSDGFIDPTVHKTLTSTPKPTPPVITPSKMAYPKKTYDVTKSKRYNNSLSALLGAMSDNPDSMLNTDNPALKRLMPSEERSKSEPKNNCSQNLSKVGVSEISCIRNLSQESKRAVPVASTNPYLVQRKSEQQQSDISTEVADPKPRKRPCPSKFKEPTLKKTTRSLFSSFPNNYLKGCKWSPDGLSLLTCSRDKLVRIFNVPDITSVTEQSPVGMLSLKSSLY